MAPKALVHRHVLPTVKALDRTETWALGSGKQPFQNSERNFNGIQGFLISLLEFIWFNSIPVLALLVQHLFNKVQSDPCV